MFGRIKSVQTEKGYFFIRTQGDNEPPREYFGHKSGLRDGLTINDLREGLAVSFVAHDDAPKGPRAEDISRAHDDADVL